MDEQNCRQHISFEEVEGHTRPAPASRDRPKHHDPGERQISSLSSRNRPCCARDSVVQRAIRDKWIRWDPDNAIREFTESPTRARIRGRLADLDSLVGNVYVADLVRDGVPKRADLRHPTKEVIRSLGKGSLRAIKLHRQNPDAVTHKAMGRHIGTELALLARTNLFRSKRCRQLAALLEIRETFNKKQIERLSKSRLQVVVQEAGIADAVRRLTRFVKLSELV